MLKVLLILIAAIKEGLECGEKFHQVHLSVSDSSSSSIAQRPESDVKLSIPGPVRNGSSVWLACNHHFNQEFQFSVKWYKNNMEFFRFTNTLDLEKRKKLFPESGINVDLSHSNLTHVRLKVVDLSYEGTYGCEVSTEDDRSAFNSIKAEEDLRVFVLPKSPIKIVGLQAKYRHGDLVNISCVSGASRPASILFLYINGNRIQHSERGLNFSWSTEAIDIEGLAVSRIDVSFRLAKENGLSDGEIQVACESIMFQISGLSWEELIVDENGLYTRSASNQPCPSSGDALSGNSAINGHHQIHAPRINGLRKRYKIGDRLTANCSSRTNYNLVSHLTWLINEKEVSSNYLSSYLIPQPQVNHRFSPFLPAQMDRFSRAIQEYFSSKPHSQHLSEPSEATTLNILGVSFHITKKHYQTLDSRMRLRCLSTFAEEVNRENVSLKLIVHVMDSSFLASRKVNSSDDATRKPSS